MGDVVVADAGDLPGRLSLDHELRDGAVIVTVRRPAIPWFVEEMGLQPSERPAMRDDGHNFIVRVMVRDDLVDRCGDPLP